MRKTILIILCLYALQLTAQTVSIPKDRELEKKVEKTLRSMSLEEKIGQMIQLTLQSSGNVQESDDFHFALYKDKAKEIFGKYKIGSLLNTPTLEGINLPCTPEQWKSIIKVLQDSARAYDCLPIIYGLDQIHGASYTRGSILFPQAITMGATFNRNLVEVSGEITAYETRAASIPWVFSPVLDMGRNPCWSRMWETYGEDTYLVGEMGKAIVKGLQGDNPNQLGKENTAVCLKHFLGYGVPYSGKDRTPSIISEVDLREKHFQPFVEAIRETQALSIMVNSGIINGIPVHADYKLLTQWLKNDLVWDGMIVTDWADIDNLYRRDKVVKDRKEAVLIAFNAGIDMAMVPYDVEYADLLKELVKEGKIKISRIDDAVRRILRLKYRVGIMDDPYLNSMEYDDFSSEKHANAALKAAEEAITLLKNKNNILPLKKGTKILVTGPNSNNLGCLNGGWSYSWQGEKVDQYENKERNTILEAIRLKNGDKNTLYEPGLIYTRGKTSLLDPEASAVATNYQSESGVDIDRVLALAYKSDVIVLCLGENTYCETPGNLNDLTLSKNQLYLAHELIKTGKPIVLVLNQGRPRVISSIEPAMDAVLNTYLPGSFGGDALANILFGEVNPSGKLPFTYPKYPNSLTTYDYKMCEQMDKMSGNYDYSAVISSQWAFGYGLSYTEFAYSNLKVDKSEFKKGDILSFSVDVKNVGDVKGKEAILLFSTDKVASLAPDNRRLRAFEKIELMPGETKTIEIKVKADDLAFVGANYKWRLEEGEFMIQIGTQSIIVNCTDTYVWKTDIK